MVALLINVAFIVAAIGVVLAIADGALRWWSAFSTLRLRVYPNTAFVYTTMRRDVGDGYAGFLRNAPCPSPINRSAAA